MTFEKIFVIGKMKLIDGYIIEAKRLFRFSAEEILDDLEKLHTAERIFQLIIDEMLDINQHFIKEMDFKTADDFQGTFYILGENNVLPKDFAFKIAPATGVRNILVHRYEELDRKLFITTFRKNYTDFEDYLKFIKKFVEK